MYYFFFFLAILNLQLMEMEFSRKLRLSGKLKPKGLTHFFWMFPFWRENFYKYCILWLCAVEFWLWKLRTRFSEVFVFWGKMKRLAQRNKIKLIKILFSLETSMHFSRKILISEVTPYFSHTRILTSFGLEKQGDCPEVYNFYSNGKLQKKCVNPLDFNFPRIHNLLENPHSHQLWL